MFLGPDQAHTHCRLSIIILTSFWKGKIFVKVYVRDSNNKCVHIVMEMYNSMKASLAATCEQILLNVNLDTRKSLEYPEWAKLRLENISKCFEGLQFPVQTGAKIGLRRK